MKLDTSKVDLTNDNQKIFAGILAIAVLFLLYWALPPLVFILKNLWIAAVLGLPIVFIALNPMLVWNIFKQLSWSLTKGLISGDKLGYMYRYHDYLLGKIDNLQKSILSVGAIKTKLTRKISELNTTIKENKQKAISYQDKNAAPTVIRTLQNKVAIDTKQLENLLPKVVNVEAQMKALTELHDLWLADTEDLKYTLDAKAEEYKLLKELNSATGNASEFLKGNSEEFKIYQESLKQIEDSVATYTANLENFERQARPLIDSLSMERSVQEDAGAKLIEEFKANSISLRIEE
jgi:hypothetical protein